MLSYQRDRNVHVGIIHGNQQDRNSGGEIWSRIDFRCAKLSLVLLTGCKSLCVANSYLSCYRELINPSAVTLPAEFIQLDWKFGHDASNFSRRITAK